VIQNKYEHNSDLELLQDFKQSFLINEKGEGVIDIGNKRITVSGSPDITNSAVEVVGDTPITFIFKNRMFFLLEDPEDPEQSTWAEIMDTSMSAPLVDIFQQRFPEIRDEAHLKALLEVFTVTLPEYQNKKNEEVFRYVMQNYLVPVERQRLAQLRKDPTSIRLEEVQYRQVLYNYAKKLAMSMGKTEKYFFDELEYRLNTPEFLGGQWLSEDQDGRQMILLSKVQREHSEYTDKLLYSALWLRSKEEATAISKEAEILGYEIGYYWSHSGHHFIAETGIIVPNYDISTPATRYTTETTIETSARQLDLKDMFMEPKPIEEFDSSKES
jgi:hypothetical protein